MAKRSGIMLCYPFEEKRLAKWNPPYLVQPKLDGVRCRAVPSHDGNYKLLSSEGNEIISVPHINKQLDKSKLWPLELDGELYNHYMPFEDIVSITGRTVNRHPEYELIQFHIFDIVQFGILQFRRSAMLESCINRLDFRQTVLNLSPSERHIRKVSQTICNSFDEVMTEYDALIDKDYEGMIVRNWENLYVPRRSTYIMKFKPKKDDYYKIVGFKEEMTINGEPKGRLGAFICESDGAHFSVGSGLTDSNKEQFWKSPNDYVGKLLRVAYQHVTSGKGVPRFPIFLEVVDAEVQEVALKNAYLVR